MSFKTKLPFIPFLLLLFLFTACQKEKIIDPTELTYKRKFETLLKIDPQSNNKVSSNSDVTHFNFKNYEEAYNYFKFLESKQPFSHIDTAHISSDISERTSADADWRLITYSAFISTASSVSESWGISSVLLNFSLSYQIGFSTINTSKAILSNTPGSGSLFYSGVGTASGSPTITSGGAFSYSGSIGGGMQGQATIAGSSFSFYLVLHGTYSFSVPNTPEESSLVSTSFYVTSSSIGGGGTPP
jgi:hypothetical protein